MSQLQPHPEKGKTPPPASKAVLEVAKLLIDQKALDVSVLEVKGMSDIADYLVIASGTSERHTQGLADRVVRGLKDLGERPIATSGIGKSEWVLLDYGDFMVHVFYEAARQYYSLDELWENAKIVPLPEELEQVARRLRTGMIRSKSN